MTEKAPIILWLRRDFRLADHPALAHAIRQNRPIIPLFILDPILEKIGAAPRWRLGRAIKVYAKALQDLGARLILRKGAALDVLRNVMTQTGAKTVYWTRAYMPEEIARDQAVKAHLLEMGYEARSFGGHLLFEPWEVATKLGGAFRVYSPFWRAVAARPLPEPIAAPSRLRVPESWPSSLSFEALGLAAGLNRAGPYLEARVAVGEAKATEKLAHFVAGPLDAYRQDRNRPDLAGCSNLSAHLAWGEISPLSCWQAAHDAMRRGNAGAEVFCKELVWREFAYHLAYHFPHILDDNWKEDWQHFPWQHGAGSSDFLAWQQGRTGIAFVDAAMRELYVTGVMHNRARMIVASFLTKHLLIRWQDGLRWFADCLIDWDPASNAMGWQWVAGAGPDAAPYFRIFNPQTQREKFDPHAHYTGRWLAEGQAQPHADALQFFDMIPKAWNLSPSDRRPAPIIDLATGRARALDAYKTLKLQSG